MPDEFRHFFFQRSTRQIFFFPIQLSAVIYFHAAPRVYFLKYIFVKTGVMEKHLDICAIIIAVFSSVMILFLAPKANSVIGDWEILYPNRQKMSLHFKDDGTFTGIRPATHFIISGKYLVDGTELDLYSPGGKTIYWGKYQTNFFNDDSLMATVIDDTCRERRMATNREILRRTEVPVLFSCR